MPDEPLVDSTGSGWCRRRGVRRADRLRLRGRRGLRDGRAPRILDRLIDADFSAAGHDTVGARKRL